MSEKAANRYYMPFYIERWLASTAGMTAAQKGVYIDLLALQFDNQAGIVTDNQIDFNVRPRDPEATAQILAAKFQRVDGGYRNARLEERRAYHDKKRNAGKRGGQAKALANRLANPLADRPPNPLPQNEIRNTESEIPKPVNGRYIEMPDASPDIERNSHQEEQPGSRWNSATEARALRLAINATSQLPPANSRQDRRLVAVASILAVTQLSENWFHDCIGGVTKSPATRPYAKLQSVLRERARQLHQFDYDATARSLDVPKDFYDSIESEIKPR